MQSPEFKQYEKRLKQYAALAGPFAPNMALAAVFGSDTTPDPTLYVQLLSALAPTCTVATKQGRDVWTMRTAPRHATLRDSRKTKDELPTVEGDPIAAQIPDALLGNGHFAPDRIFGGMQHSAYSIDELDEFVRVLDRAGPAAPAYCHLSTLISMRNRLDRVARTEDALAAGFVGRTDEVAKIEAWLRNRDKSSDQLKTLHISGIPGIGKSFLLEHTLSVLAETQPNTVVLRLDFDRSALRVDKPSVLFLEISRQIGDELPFAASDLANARHRTVEAERDSPSQEMDVPSELLSAVSGALKDPEGLVVVIVDTLEALRAKGDTHVRRLFEQLDILNSVVAPPVRVISAGRAEAIWPERARIEHHVELTGLEDAAARDLLRAREVGEPLWSRILPVAKGIPLRLVLAGKAAELGVFEESGLPIKGSESAVEGYLYRAILSRVPREIRKIASEGLIVHRMSADVLREVVGPALDMDIDTTRAQGIIDDLERQHWLVKPGVADGWIMHRDDIRATVLDLIYRESPAITADIDRRAAKWFADKDPETALYHRLQMLRHGDALPEVPARLARRFTDPMLDDLLPEAADAVRQARGERSEFARQKDADQSKGSGGILATQKPSSLPPQRPQFSRLVYDKRRRRLRVIQDATPEYIPDKRMIRDLENMLQKQDLREALYVLENGLEGPVPVEGHLAQLALAVTWRHGQWSVSRAIFNASGGRARDAWQGDVLSDVALTILEMQAEFHFKHLQAHLRDPEAAYQATRLFEQADETSLHGGALAFAVLSVKEVLDPNFLESRYMVRAMAAEGLHGTEPHAALVLRTQDAADKLRNSAGLDWTSDGPSEGEYGGRRFAPLNPYSTPLLHVVRAAVRARRDEDSTSRLIDYLLELEDFLPSIAEHFAPLLSGVEHLSIRGPEPAVDVARFLSNMGLTAHWAGAFRVAHPVQDVPEIARAAERWRRVMNGNWAYDGDPPEGWTGLATSDYEANALLANLSERSSAVDALRAWAITDDPEPEPENATLARLHRVLSNKDAKKDAASDASRSETPPQHVQRLIDADVPLSLAAPWVMSEPSE